LLDKAWASKGKKKTNAVVIVAPGGVGKTSLVQRWRQQLAREKFRGAERVFDWSFYSQGARETEASADAFFDEALRWFGEADPTQLRDPWQKGDRLAQLVRQSRTLLVLDGLEPMQYPPGQYEGHFKDLGLRALVISLAEQNPGLVILTSREQVQELAGQDAPIAERVCLSSLEPAAGAALLRKYGVQGKQADLKKASAEFDGHSLALVLLATFLTECCNGDILKRNDHLEGLLQGNQSTARHARRMLRSYEVWFERAGSHAEVALLRLLGLFDRPAEWSSLEALMKPPAIAELTEALIGLTSNDLRSVVRHLCHAGLVENDFHGADGHVRAHPLISECEADWVRRNAPVAWQAAHLCLYKHLTESTEPLPSTFDGIRPLYAAVRHGCLAGIHEKAFREVYDARICRGEEAFAHRELATFGNEIVALSCFFEQGWLGPVSSLSAPTRALILGMTGSRLRAVGRLDEALGLASQSCKCYEQLKDWKDLARRSRHVAEMEALLGFLERALVSSRDSVSYADASEDNFERIIERTIEAYVLHQSGQLAGARSRFQEAEQLFSGLPDGSRHLRTLWGFRYADLLIDLDQIDESIERAREALSPSSLRTAAFTLGIIDNPLMDLLLAKAHGARHAKLANSHEALLACKFAEQAVAGLRNAGRIEFLVLGLVSLSECRHYVGEERLARHWLDEAEKLATRCGMRLFQTDAHLLRARFELFRNPAKACEHLAQARQLIADTGYHRRDPELVLLEAKLAEIG